MDRETKTIETPINGHKVVIREWITGRERRELRRPFTEHMKVKSDRTGKAKVDLENTGKIIEQVEDNLIKMVVESVDGKEEGVLDAILDMREKDFNFVMEEIEKASGGAGFTRPESVDQ